MKRGFVVIAGLLLLAGGAYLILHGVGTLPEAKRKPGVPPQALTIYYTCDTRGHIEPCGCTSGMAGGIARRKTYILSQRAEHALIVDAGDVTAGPREWELFELEHILKGYEQVGYHAVNAGHREASIGLQGLLDIKSRYGKFVSANLIDETGKPVFAPYALVEFPGQYTVAVIGVMDDALPTNEIGKGLKLIPPHDAIAKYLPEMKDKSDMIVLLIFADEEKMKAVAERFYEIFVIVGGKVRQPSATPLVVNKSIVTFITDKGKSVGKLDLALGRDKKYSHTNDIVMLNDGVVKDDPAIVSMIEEYKVKLKAKDFQPHKDDEEGLSAISSPRSKDANTYAGAESCKSCHREAFEIWGNSRHAHAFQTLVGRNYETNPRCLKCHTVGYMSSDGYLNQKLTPHLKDVSCESCHGRGDLHIKRQSGEDIPSKQALFKKVNCGACHDTDNSPNFEFPQYWEKIKHGKN